MPDRDNKTAMGTEDTHESKVSMESQDALQDAQPPRLFHSIKVRTVGQSREGATRSSS